MGLGSHIPFEVSQRVIPKIPRRWQRFQPAVSWMDATDSTIGYSSVPFAAAIEGVDFPSPLTGNALGTVAAFGVALQGTSGINRPIRVVDFGGRDGRYFDLVQGAFGATSLEWTVVDLPEVVACAVERPGGPGFTADLNEALEGRPDIVFASASVNYLDDPLGTLESLCHASTCVIVTRLPLWPIARHQAAVQRAQRRPTEISYPTWFFSEKAFLQQVAQFAEVSLDFECPDDRASFAGSYLKYRGLVLNTMNAPQG